jgi:hypothetical protein
MKNVAVLVVSLFACGALIGCESSASLPTAPAAISPGPTVTGLVLTAPDSLFLGATTQLGASVLMSSGSPQLATCTWNLDAPQIAAIDASGVMTGLGAGQVTIWCDASGRRASKLVRVLPNYTGNWMGTYIVTGCADSGVFTDANFCGKVSGAVAPYTLILTQTRDEVTGRFLLGSIQFEQTSATVSMDGHIVLASHNISGGITSDTVWSVNQLTTGRLTGTLHDQWQMPGALGSGDVDGAVATSSKGVASNTFRAPVPTLDGLLKGLRQ